MTAEALKISFLFYLKNLGLYDYLAFCWLIITFFILIFLAILIARKSSSLSLLLILLSVLLFVVAPFMIKWKLNNYLRPVVAEVTSVKKLIFSDSLIIETEIKNISKKEFKKCLIETNIIKDNHPGFLQSYINLVKPLDNKSILVQRILPKDDYMEYRIVFDNFSYESNVTAKIKAECY